MAARKRFKSPLPPKEEPCEYVQGINPKECPHGLPLDPDGKPILCLECDSAIQGRNNPVFRHGQKRRHGMIDPRQLRGAPAPPASALRPETAASKRRRKKKK
jgi:hypothetical protein